MDECYWYGIFFFSPSHEAARRSCEVVADCLESPARSSLRRPWLRTQSSLDALLDVAPVRSLGIFRLEQPQVFNSPAIETEASEASVVAAEIEMGEGPESSLVDESSPMERTSLGSILQESQMPERNRRRARRSPSVSSVARRQRPRRSKASRSPRGQGAAEEDPAPPAIDSPVCVVAPIEDPPAAEMVPVETPLTAINPEAHRFASWDEEPEAVRRVEEPSPSLAVGRSSPMSSSSAASRIRLSTRLRHWRSGQADDESREESAAAPSSLAVSVPEAFPKPAWVLPYYPESTQIRGLLK